MAQQGPLSNQKLGDKYLLGELLGQGSFGAVYAARHMLLDREQAIKILLDHHFTNPEFRDRFVREARMLAALDHPNIVHVDDFGFEGNRAYLVMPYIGGGTLQDRLGQQEPFALDEAQRYLEQMCAALEYAHARNIAHLDLKPSNLLISNDKRLLLSDFGLAHLLEQGLVKGGASLGFGTPQYMAPEHSQGQPELRSDLYSLGVLLYQMLAGRLPFEGDTVLALRYKHEKETPPPLRTFRPELAVELEEVMAKMLAKRPEDRYQTAAELLAAFKMALVRQASQILSQRHTGSITTPLRDQPSLEEFIRAALASLPDSPVLSEATLDEHAPGAPAENSVSASTELTLPSDRLRENNTINLFLSGWFAEEPSSSRRRVILLFLQFFVLLCGILGLVAFFFLPWLQTYTSSDLIVAPSGLRLAQSGNLVWLLWFEPIGATQLIVLACLQSTKLANHAASGRWKWLLVTTAPLFTLAMFLAYVLLLGSGVIFEGFLNHLILFDNGFWLGVFSLMLGCLSGCLGVVYSNYRTAL